MEYFGFASGSSKTGPTFPYMPESVLQNYPSTLLEHPVVPTAVGFLNTYIQAPDAKTLITVVQTWADKSMELLEKPSVQALSIGLTASICAYGAWRIGKRWKNKAATRDNGDGITTHDSSEPKVKESFCDEGPTVGSCDFSESHIDIIQRQLWDTRAKLNDLRYHLNRLEGEKDLLAAEVSMRKKIVVQIQDEIHVERDKRRQAELKMEMMEWENTHLRRLRKDLAVKDGTIETLEASLKEKDEIHDKLFRENVILPKTIAEARAREYEILHTKVQKYEKEADAKRNIESPNKLSKNNSVQLASNQPHYEDTKAPMKTIFQTQRQPEFGSSETCLLSDWDKSPSSTGSAMPPMLFASNLIDRTKTLLYSSKNWSNSSEKARIGEQVGEHYCKKEGSVQRDDWEKIQMGVKSPNLPSQAFSFKQNNNVDQQSLHTNRLSAVPGPFSEYSSHPLCNVEYDPGPLIPFTTFCNDDFPKGTQESDHKTAARRANTVTDQSGICERSFADKMFSRYQDGEVEDACCKSVSDGSIFASCGSDISDDDNRNVSRSLNHSYLTGHSRKHITSAATAKPFRRNTSPDMAVPLKRNMSKVRSRSKVKELHYEYSSFPNPVSKFNSAFEKNFYSREIVLSENTTSHAEIEAKQQFDTSYSEGRARPRRRMEIPRSQPPVTPDLRSSRGSEPISTAGNLGSQAPLPDMLLSENRPTLPPSHASSVIVNQAPNMKMYKKCTDPRQITYPISDYQAVSQMVDVNQSSTIARDADSEESWIVIGPPI